jgi:hypothetical protein
MEQLWNAFHNCSVAPQTPSSKKHWGLEDRVGVRGMPQPLVQSQKDPPRTRQETEQYIAAYWGDRRVVATGKLEVAVLQFLLWSFF